VCVCVSIDDDIESVSRNVSGAYGELLKYIPKVTANRWLYLKIFGILVVFMVLFIVFFV
jgi:syntaxin 5